MRPAPRRCRPAVRRSTAAPILSTSRGMSVVQSGAAIAREAHEELLADVDISACPCPAGAPVRAGPRRCALRAPARPTTPNDPSASRPASAAIAAASCGSASASSTAPVRVTADRRELRAELGLEHRLVRRSERAGGDLVRVEPNANRVDGLGASRRRRGRGDQQEAEQGDARPCSARRRGCDRSRPAHDGISRVLSSWAGATAMPMASERAIPRSRAAMVSNAASMQVLDGNRRRGVCKNVALARHRPAQGAGWTCAGVRSREMSER